MLALALPIVTGLSLSALTGGQLARLRSVYFRGALLGVSALVVQILLFSPVLEALDWSIRFGPMVYVATMLVVSLVLIRNMPDQPGRAPRLALAAAAAGVLLNCAVVIANHGYMPRAAVGGHAAVANPTDVGRLVNVTPMTVNTPLWWLGDVLPEPTWWPLSNVLSVGDVLLSSGLACWVVTITRARPRRTGL